MNVRLTIFLAGVALSSAVLPARAVTMPALQLPTTSAETPVIQVRSHGHWHHGGHYGHRRDHRFHGRDDYYDRDDDQSGVLFKSFITGTLFR